MAKIEKHYIEFVEELLYNYKFFEVHIENLEEMLNDIDRGIFIQGINYKNEKISPTYKIQNLIMDNAVDIAEAKKEIEIKLYLERRLKRNLDKNLNNLLMHIKEIVEMRYFKQMSWDCITDKFCCDKKTAIKYKNEAIKSIAVGLFGGEILKQENPTLFDELKLKL